MTSEHLVGFFYNQLEKYLKHCTIFWLKGPVHDLVLCDAPLPLIKVASNTRPCSKRRGTTLNGREEAGLYCISQTYDEQRFEARAFNFLYENPIKMCWKTHEPTFRGHENGDFRFHGVNWSHKS